MKATIKKFKKGDYLLHQNEDSSHMFIINSGTIRVFREEGDNVTFQTDVGEGATVGEIALIDPGPRSASAVALEDVETSIIYPEDVKEANKSCPDWLQALARTLALRTRSVLANIERNPNKYIESSIISLLIYLSIANNENLIFDKTDLVKDCVDILRLTSEEFEGYLLNLEKKGLLEVKEFKVNLLNIEQLETYNKKVLKGLENIHLAIFKP